VLTHEYVGQKEWASTLATKTGIEHIDLLDTFLSDETLRNMVGSFGVDDFFRYIQGKKGPKVLVVTGMEFLRATWTGQANVMEKFASQVEMWANNPALLIVMQFDPCLAKRPFTRFPDRLFVVDQKNTFAVT
jgi:hypothetical protein